MPQLRTLLALLCCLGFASCDAVVPQHVSGRAPVESVDLRWYDTVDCTGNFSSVRASSSGEFTFIGKTWKGGVSEIVEDRSLCVSKAGVWSVLWASRHAGGAGRLTLVCTSMPEASYTWLSERQPCEAKFEHVDA